MKVIANFSAAEYKRVENAARFCGFEKAGEFLHFLGTTWLDTVLENERNQKLSALLEEFKKPRDQSMKGTV